MAHRAKAVPDIREYVPLLRWGCLLAGAALLLGIGLRWWLQDTPEKALGRYLRASQADDVTSARLCFSDGYLRIFDTGQGLWVKYSPEHRQTEYGERQAEWLRVYPESLRLHDVWSAVVSTVFGFDCWDAKAGRYVLLPRDADEFSEVRSRLRLDGKGAAAWSEEVRRAVGKPQVQDDRACVSVIISVLPDREERQPFLGRRPVWTRAFLRFRLVQERGRWLIADQEYCGLEWGQWRKLGIAALVLWNTLFACLYSATLIGLSYPLWPAPAAAWYVRLPGGGRGGFVRTATEKEAVSRFGRQVPELVVYIVLANLALACYYTFGPHEIYFPTLPTWLVEFIDYLPWLR